MFHFRQDNKCDILMAILIRNKYDRHIELVEYWTECGGPSTVLSEVFWHFTPCQLAYSYRHFEGSERFQLQGQAVQT